MTRRTIGLLFVVLIAGAAMAAKLTWPELLERAHPKADARIDYGPGTLQHADLWLPKGPAKGTVLMVHGGCWQSRIAKADIMDWIADDLRGRGIAVWNVEYRGVDISGGGYPGTFQDVAAGADALREQAAKYHLPIERVVAVGHSAGGHLVLWLAARKDLPAGSLLRAPDPLPIHAAISLGGLPDLEMAAVPPGNTCGSEAVEKLVGAASPQRPDPYADTSPARLPQPAIPITLINGSEDRIAPPAFAEAYALRVRGAPKRVLVKDAGHVELIAPETPAWARAVAAIEAALK